MLPSKKSHRITVDDVHYRYIISESGASQSNVVPLSFHVQHREKNGAQLRVVGLTTVRVPEEESKYYMGRTVNRLVKPSHTELLVRLARSLGWKPELPGPAFVITVSNSEVFGEEGEETPHEYA